MPLNQLFLKIVHINLRQFSNQSRNIPLFRPGYIIILHLQPAKSKIKGFYGITNFRLKNLCLKKGAVICRHAPFFMVLALRTGIEPVSTVPETVVLSIERPKRDD